LPVCEACSLVRLFAQYQDNESIDFCFCSQAFHHADDPQRLLNEIKRVLKPSGIVLMIGENPVYIFDFIKTYIKNLIKRNNLQIFLQLRSESL